METLLEVFTLGVAVAPPKRTDAEVETLRIKLAQHRRPPGNVKSEGAQTLLDMIAASLGRPKSSGLTSSSATFATTLTPSELRQRVHLWMDALDQLGFSGNMLYYHVHLVARKLEREHAHRGEAVNVIARYWRYAGWHLPAANTPNTMAGFDAWIYYIMKLDVNGDGWEFTKAFNAVFRGQEYFMHQSSAIGAAYNLLYLMMPGLFASALCDDRGTSLAGLCLWIDNMDEITVHQARFAVSAIPSVSEHELWDARILILDKLLVTDTRLLELQLCGGDDKAGWRCYTAPCWPGRMPCLIVRDFMFGIERHKSYKLFLPLANLMISLVEKNEFHMISKYAEADTLAHQLCSLYKATGTLRSTLSDCTGALKCDQMAYDPQWRTRPELAFHGQQVPIRFHMLADTPITIERHGN